MIYEDFYPVTNTKAYLVTGSALNRLTAIKKAKYKIEDKKIVIIDTYDTQHKGGYLRLGNIFNGVIAYSDGYPGIIYINDIPIREGMQPFIFDEGIVYQNKGRIYLNDKLLIEPWGEYQVVCRPTFSDGWVYFETRKKVSTSGQVAAYWEVWRFNMESKEKQRLLKYGANPYVFKGKLFYSKWFSGMFHTHVEKLKDLNVEKRRNI